MKIAFIVLGDTFFGRFATLEFLERMRLQPEWPQTAAQSTPTTKPYPNSSTKVNQDYEGRCSVSCGYVLQFNVSNLAYFSETTLKVLLASIFG
jgi:hypothetical protein